jgi:hypothetical protein
LKDELYWKFISPLKWFITDPFRVLGVVKSELELLRTTERVSPGHAFNPRLFYFSASSSPAVATAAPRRSLSHTQADP